MFFKSNKKIKTGDLKLADFDKIWTKFCFLDETGTLSDQKDQYFTVGILKMSQPYYLQSKLFFERSKIRFYDEVKFNKLSKNNLKPLVLALCFITKVKKKDDSRVDKCSFSVSTLAFSKFKRLLLARTCFIYESDESINRE